jgi:hypothetical protein
MADRRMQTATPSSGGRQEERRVLYSILRDIWDLGSSKKYINLLQCGVQPDNWRRRLRTFQRFRDILESDSEMSRLAHRLFDYEDPDAGPARVMLLSATPYKMYTMHHEAEAEDHYADFIRTLRFLFDNAERTERFEELLRRYRDCLLDHAEDHQALLPIKDRIQEELRGVMVRNERFRQVEAPDGMVTETFGSPRLDPAEVGEYAHLKRVSQEVDTYDFLQYWKSAPYLMSFMDSGYKAKQRIEEHLERTPAGEPPSPQLAESLRRASLRAADVEAYKPIEPKNARMRVMMEDMLEEQQSWRLLWMPPSLPYYRPGGPYREVEHKEVTKSLVFSSWRLVPRVIAMLMSYEAERRMIGDCEHSYSDLLEERRPLLLFRAEDGHPQNLASLALFYPCVTLARAIDPCRLASSIPGGNGPPERVELLGEAARKVRRLLRGAGIEVVHGTGESRRERDDLWRSMLALDRAGDRSVFEGAVGRWFGTDDEDLAWTGMVAGRKGETGAGWNLHVEQARQAFEEDPAARTVSDETVNHLARLAIASPAVTALRALLRSARPQGQKEAVHALAGAARIAMGFRSRFNQPWAMELIRSDDPSEPYWWRVLRYCEDGNLQAVMDEYAHVLCETEGLARETPAMIHDTMAEHISSVLSIRAANLTYDTFDERATVPDPKPRMRCHFALRLGDDREVATAETGMRRNVVRNAFNSPFHPFALATTSIGQEGLDFHL